MQRYIHIPDIERCRTGSAEVLPVNKRVNRLPAAGAEALPIVLQTGTGCEDGKPRIRACAFAFVCRLRDNRNSGGNAQGSFRTSVARIANALDDTAVAITGIPGNHPAYCQDTCIPILVLGIAALLRNVTPGRTGKNLPAIGQAGPADRNAKIRTVALANLPVYRTSNNGGQRIDAQTHGIGCNSRRTGTTHHTTELVACIGLLHIADTEYGAGPIAEYCW